eukprot:587794-Pyramimonas_sp.AAC.3
MDESTRRRGSKVSQSADNNGTTDTSGSSDGKQKARTRSSSLLHCGQDRRGVSKLLINGSSCRHSGKLLSFVRGLQAKPDHGNGSEVSHYNRSDCVRFRLPF